MVELIVQLDGEFEIVEEDFLKALCFISEDMDHYKLEGGKLTVVFNEQATVSVADREAKLLRLINQYKGGKKGPQEHVLFDYPRLGRYFEQQELEESGCLQVYGSGLIGFQKQALELIRYFDETFCGFALQMGAIEKMYPVLLPAEAMTKTGYLRTSPQYSMFVSNVREDMDCLSQIAQAMQQRQVSRLLTEPHFVLSPAACFHCFLEHEGALLEHNNVVTLRQHVFRNEGRMNWHQYGRLRDYQVREVVFIGDFEFVTSMRDKMMEKTRDWLQQIGLGARFCLAHDAFIVPSMHRFKKLQLMEQSKIELQLAVDENRYIACASFNYHGKAFSEPFSFKLADGADTVSGCVGFGLERWVLAFLSQFGSDPFGWPDQLRAVKQAIEDK